MLIGKSAIHVPDILWASKEIILVSIYIQKQEAEDKRLDQLDFFRSEDSHRKDREKETTK